MSQTLAGAQQALRFGDIAGHAAEQLRKLLEVHGLLREPGNSAIVSEVLNFAAQAEQRLAEQDARIHHLESLTTTDDLTGLYNRRGFMEGFHRALQSARRYSEEGVIAYIDIDNFKPINDTYGHHAGDLILRRVGELLLANVRKTDIVGRLGGDEFAILLVHSERQIGRKRAETLRQLLNANNLKYESSIIPIRVSLGCADYNSLSQPEDLLRKADRAMYREKKSRARKLSLISTQ